MYVRTWRIELPYVTAVPRGGHPYKMDCQEMVCLGEDRADELPRFRDGIKLILQIDIFLRPGQTR